VNKAKLTAPKIPGLRLVGWLRTIDGEPDWSEDCVTVRASDMLDMLESYNDSGRDDSYSAIPLYTPVEVVPASRQIAGSSQEPTR
jgi:hypothetical protein